MTVELIQGLLLAFAIVVILMPPYIRLLRATGFTKQIRIEGPDSHQVKHGTPTMGGALIITVVLLLYFLFRWPPEGGQREARLRSIASAFIASARARANWLFLRSSLQLRIGSLMRTMVGALCFGSPVGAHISSSEPHGRSRKT